MGLLKDDDLPEEHQPAKGKASGAMNKVRVVTDSQADKTTAGGSNQSPVPTGEDTGMFIDEKSAVVPADLLEPPAPDMPANSGNDQEASLEPSSPGDDKTFQNASRLKIPSKFRLTLNKGLFRRAAWDVSAIFSLLLNTILLTVIVILTFQIHTLKGTVNNLVGGLYNNFIALDNSVITTTLTVPNMTIPLDFPLQVNQPSTNVTLTEDVTIHGARIVIDTGTLSINSDATVTLPSGTTLPVSLNMVVPVKTDVLVNLSVPVVIKLSESNPAGDQQVGLHDAFLGLQNTLGPYYCLFNPDIVAGGVYVCQQGEYLPKPVNP